MHLWPRIWTNSRTSGGVHNTQPEGGGARTKINMYNNWQQYATYAGRVDTAGSSF